jgi:hypothetical protein
MSWVYAPSEVVRRVPGATVRLAATTVGIDIGGRHARVQLIHAGPRRVAVERSDGRVDVVRPFDLDAMVRVGIGVLGAVVARRLRRRTRSSR